MKPTIVVDSTALHGRRPFTRSDSALLLELARTDRVRLLLPDIVLHELSRQWAENVTRASAQLSAVFADLNGLLDDAVMPSLPNVVSPEVDRSTFYRAAAELLTGKGVEIMPCPDLSTAELLDRDISLRKPFSSKGNGFRDALIWENVKSLGIGASSSTPVLFVTNNSYDFCDEQDKTRLHADLRGELPGGSEIEVVPHLRALLGCVAKRFWVRRGRVLNVCLVM